MSIGRKQYPFDLIEPKWQAVWDRQQTFRAWNPGETVPAGHPFGLRHGLAGKTPSAAELPPKYYVLDMFPYPSGTGLHVGHPEGYTATDILARYRRSKGFNVLHPMGWDSFGLPAEQYAVKTGQHPRVTTEANIANFTRQIKSLGFSYDWSREIATTDPEYFKWTQWIFLKLYNSWFNPETNKAESIETLKYPAELDAPLPALSPLDGERVVARPGEGNAMLDSARRVYRDSKRLAFVSEAPVNWCPELGTVLANEEVIDGKSEVGGFPVVRRPMRQWMLRITAYAERLIDDLNTIDWTDSLKEMQRNWIGRSEGAEVDFQVAGSTEKIRVFTTRPDTLFGATYMVLAPESKIVDELIKRAAALPLVNAKITPSEVNVFDSTADMQEKLSLADALIKAKSQNLDLILINPDSNPPQCLIQDFGLYRYEQGKIKEQAEAVRNYREQVARKSDLERTELAKDKTGVFTGAYAINPVNGKKIPIWIADYVLASYGTGAIMAVPAHDERDFEFAINFKLPIHAVVKPPMEWLAKNGAHLQVEVCAEGKQLLWTYGELIAVAKKGDKTSESLASEVYVQHVTDFSAAFGDTGVAINSGFLDGLPTPEAKKKITAWLEEKHLGKKTINYKLRDWLFSRQRYWGEPFPIVWKKDAAGNLHHEALPESALPVLPPTLEDYKPTAEGQPPLARAKDWVNLPDGSVRETNTMPQWAGSCWYYLRYLDSKNSGSFVGKDVQQYWMGSSVAAVYDRLSGAETALRRPADSATPGVDLYVGGTEHAVLHLLYARFWHKFLYDLGLVSTTEPFFKLVNQGMVLGEDNQKMSKSRGNVIPVDEPVREVGTDALRLYEMFMGPLEMVKPWSSKGVEGVYRFLGRVWRLFVDEASETEFEQAMTAQPHDGAAYLEKIRLGKSILDIAATPAQLKALHTCIKKVTEDLDGLRFNTAISALMVFINEAMTWEIRPKSVLRDFLILLQPFAPHVAEELASKLNPGANSSATLAYAVWPKFDPALLVEDTMEIPVQVNGKFRDTIRVASAATQEDMQAAAFASEKVKPFIDGKQVKKVIIVPKRMVNIVVA